MNERNGLSRGTSVTSKTGIGKLAMSLIILRERKDRQNKSPERDGLAARMDPFSSFQDLSSTSYL